MPVLVKVAEGKGGGDVAPAGTLPKLMLGGEATARGPSPAPSNARTCGFPGALSVTPRNAPSAPTTFGVNCTSKLQNDPGLIGDAKHGAGLTARKSPLLGPVIAMLEIVSSASPLLTIPTGNGGTFVIPTF